MKKLRLVLGDQLNQKHTWFNTVNDDVTYLMAEMRQETDYVKHHIQKVVALFLAMRSFKDDLTEKGHRFVYLKINDTDNPQDLEKIITKYVKETNSEKFEYQLPDEFRLDQQLKQIFFFNFFSYSKKVEQNSVQLQKLKNLYLQVNSKKN